MTMGMRDPRENPQEGDVLRNRDGVTFYVRRREGSTIQYQEYGCGDILEHSLQAWRVDAKNDEIVERGAP